ncbi:polyphosphate polymerase domain-containing protein [Nanoarchaeota archaeon]
MRYERKFVIEELDKQEVESIIKHNPGMFSEIYHERVVNNIYLDSESLENYNDNLIGMGQRLKVRIRWYGETRGLVKKPVLEIKIKSNELGTKRSFPLKPFKVDKNLSLSFIIEKVISESNLPLDVIEHLKSLKFALLNKYKRKYFSSHDKKYRMTLDFDLEFYTIHQHSNPFIERIKSDFVILEVKYSKSDDDGAENIINNLPFRLTKSSKYVSGIDELY